MSKDLLFYDDCPICNSKLDAIKDRDDENYISDWFCSKCGISWTLEDLEYEPIQKEIDQWLK